MKPEYRPILKTVACRLYRDKVQWFVDLNPYSWYGSLKLPVWNGLFPTRPCMDVIGVAPLKDLRYVWTHRQGIAKEMDIPSPDLDSLVNAMSGQPESNDVALVLVCIDKGHNGYTVFFDVSAQRLLGYVPFQFNRPELNELATGTAPPSPAT